jgi:hypothetical protein
VRIHILLLTPAPLRRHSDKDVAFCNNEFNRLCQTLFLVSINHVCDRFGSLIIMKDSLQTAFDKQRTDPVLVSVLPLPPADHMTCPPLRQAQRAAVHPRRAVEGARLEAPDDMFNGRGRDRLCFLRKAASPLHLSWFGFKCARVATFCHVLP